MWIVVFVIIMRNLKKVLEHKSPFKLENVYFDSSMKFL